MTYANSKSAFRRAKLRSNRFRWLALMLLALVGLASCAAKDSSSTCPGGFTLCNGLCVNLVSDALNCGSCGVSCPVGGLCGAGTCGCQGNLAACESSCVDLQSDGTNCGACGTPCGAGLVCSLGTCAAGCAVGLTQCGTSCVDPLANVQHCGTCGNVCAAGLACTNGVCSCSVAGQASCGGSCVDTLNNPANCGTCGNVCSGGTACVSGSCQCPVGQDCSGGTGGALGTGGAGTGGAGTGGVGTGGVATGGAGTGGAATGGAGTGGAATECTPGVDCGGYIVSGSWHGYAFTSKYGTATIAPADFSAVTDFPLCASGTVPASATGANGAMIGWSVNQPANPDGAPSSTITPSKDGITVSVTNNSSAQLRLQIQGPNGATQASDRWCAQIGTGGSNIFVPYSSFNTVCWPGETGTAYKGQPITQVLVTVSAAAAASTSYNFCIGDIAETDDPGTSGGTGCSLSAAVPGSALSGTLAYAGGQYQRKAVNTGSKLIYVQNNVFNPPGGVNFTLDYTGDSFTISAISGSQSTGGAPIAYPSLFIGSAGGDGLATAGSNLAKKVSALTDVQTALSWTKPSGGSYNVAYDVWFSPNAGDSGSGNRTFLMVWFSRTSGIYAEGEGESHSGGTFSVGGKSFSTYVSQQFEGRPIISYVAQSEIMEWSFDLNDFITDAKTRSSSAQSAVINDNLYLTNIFAGFEIWSGAQNIKAKKFCVDVK